MATNAEIIRKSLRKINVLGETQNLTPEQGAEGLGALNGMLEVWRETSLDIGWFTQTSTTDTCPIPTWIELAVIYNLALELAAEQSVTPSAVVVAKAEEHLNFARLKLIRERLAGLDMTHMPLGSGKTGRYDIVNDT